MLPIFIQVSFWKKLVCSSVRIRKYRKQINVALGLLINYNSSSKSSATLQYFKYHPSMFVGIMHILSKLLNYGKDRLYIEWRCVSVSLYFIHFSFFTQIIIIVLFCFPFFFSLFYFCLVCAVAIMGSQPQMSLALPCSALREGHWNTEATTIQLAQQGATGQAP